MTQYKTRQELFDNALNGIRGQGYRRSLAPDGVRCLYRSPCGLKCAIGHSIPDDAYGDHLELSAVNTKFVMIAASIDWRDSGLARSLQIAHDKYGDRGPEFEDCMKRISEDYGLNYTPPEGE